MSYVLIDMLVIISMFAVITAGVGGTLWALENVFNVDVDGIMDKIFR